MATAALAGDAAGVDRWSNVSRAISTLGGAQTSHRDVKRLEQLLRDLQLKYKELTKAARAGTALGRGCHEVKLNLVN